MGSLCAPHLHIDQLGSLNVWYSVSPMSLSVHPLIDGGWSLSGLASLVLHCSFVENVQSELSM